MPSLYTAPDVSALPRGAVGAEKELEEAFVGVSFEGCGDCSCDEAEAIEACVAADCMRSNFSDRWIWRMVSCMILWRQSSNIDVICAVRSLALERVKDQRTLDTYH